MTEALEIIDSTPDLLFQCPGEPAPISRSLHDARLAAGWSRCATCSSREDSSALMPRRSTQFRTSQRILRTRWGVRGTWQNTITRQVAAQLTSIVASQLTRRHAMEGSDGNTDQQADANPQLTALAPVTIVIGYDGRDSSPDIYAGAVSATIQNGTNVIDAGRSTAAAVQEVCRSHSDVVAGLIVTGTGETASSTGFDLFDRTGNPVPIPWQDWNITVRRESVPDSLRHSQPIPLYGDAINRLQTSIRGDDLSPYPTTAPTMSDSAPQATTLQFPKTSTLAGHGYRQSRATGICEIIDSEQLYRQHLNRWFPSEVETRVTCLCSDEVVADRLGWLASRPRLALDVVPGASPVAQADQLAQRIADVHAHWGLMIPEDDRYAIVANRHGSILSAELLADWINASIRTIMPHVTAHVPDGDERVVLLDAGRPFQPDGNEVISDGLALMGCICRLIQQGNTLPHPR